MLPTDTLTCEILPNAVEGDSLSCSMPPLEHLDLWATNASVFSAVITALLALFAFLAWREQKRTLVKMEDQIIATARQAVDSRQVEFLVGYVRALKLAADRCDRPKEDLMDLASTATEAWMVWSMDLIKTDVPMREVTQWWHDFLIESMTSLRAVRDNLEDRQGSVNLSELRPVAHAYTAKRENFYSLVGSYINQIQKWQVDEDSRREVFEDLAHGRARGMEEASA